MARKTSTCSLLIIHDVDLLGILWYLYRPAGLETENIPCIFNMENWTLVYSSDQLYMAELMKQLLAENDIQAIIVNKKDSAYLFGDVELYVGYEDAFLARQIINRHENE